MQVAPIIDFGNGLRINLANDRWQTQGVRGMVCGSSGSGKSYLTAVLIEELHSIGLPWLIIDPEGEYRSLGQLPEVLVCAGDGDIQLMRGNWLNDCLKCIRSGQGLVVNIEDQPTERQRIIYVQLLTALWQGQQAARRQGVPQALVLFVEESHLFAPQKKQADTQASLDITTTVARRGRKHGINTVFISQRPGDLEKDILAQSNLRIIMRLEVEHDFEAIRSILPGGITHKTSLSLETGEFYLRIGADFHKVGPCRSRRTQDLAQTPAIQYRQRELLLTETK